jgi:CheY-like chemotaxis protein/predicted regulator of Ras-like GTPase activity (Roadblock/LC7/MglB family)
MNTKRVLIADDEPQLAEMLANSLARLGNEYVFDIVYDGAAALEQLKQHEYVLLITDYRMPEMDGLDLAREAHQIQPDMQIVLMTAHSTDDLRNTVKEGLTNGFIEKPFSVTEIREIVRRAVDQTLQKTISHKSEEHIIEPSVQKHLKELQGNTGARNVLLINTDGFPIEVVGAKETLDVTSVSALVAANFIAASELANLLGNSSIFKSSYHEGSDYNIYAYYVNDNALLVVVFGTESKTGAVWFYTKQTATALVTALADRPVGRGRSYQTVSASEKAPTAPPPPLPAVADMKTAISAELDSLFGGDPAQGQALSLLSFEEAVTAGLIAVPGSKQK